VLAGTIDSLPDDPMDFHGKPLDAALAAAGGDLARLETAVWRPGSILGYLELHIEQGPVLEAGGQRIGVVDAIVGRTVLEFDVRGVAGHAGTTPMLGRADALVGAAHVALLVADLPSTTGLCRVATVGHVEVFPNSPNTIADRVRLTVDLRDARQEHMIAAETALRSQVADLSGRLNLVTECQLMVRAQPALTDLALREKIIDSAESLGLEYHSMSSGAGHDAQIVSAVTPVGMIFVPSIGGVSHCPEEDTAEQDLIAGAQVLLGTVLRI
jgi:N-carbamoyl-L-amino-acid hydrolase